MFPVFDLLVLSQIPNIGANRLRALVSHFGNPSAVLRSSPKEFASVPGFSKKLAVQIGRFIRSSSLDDAHQFAERQLSKLNIVGGEIMTFWDNRYPDLLKRIYDPPSHIYIKGNLRESDRYALAVVGTRSPSPYGVLMAERFSQEFVKIGITVVSGLARGIDTVAHSTALKAKGRTVAVIGSGIDLIYPPENKSLAERISHDGAIISEYEMGAKPDAVNFPRRNRIISGMSLGTLIVETDVNGGAMITANSALDQNREIFAIPGNANVKRSRGCNALIKDGRAKLVETIDDVISELASKLKPLLKNSHGNNDYVIPDLSLFEKTIYDVLTDDPIHIDVIADVSHISTSDALVHLLSMEFKGLVKQLAGKTFVKV